MSVDSIEGLPIGLRIALLNTVIDIAKSNPVLSQCVKKWVVFDGTPDAIKHPTAAMMPWVRMHVKGMPIRRETEAERNVTFAVIFDLMTKGMNQANLINLQEAFENAFADSAPYLKTNVYSALIASAQAAGGSLIVATMTALDPFFQQDAENLVHSGGRCVLTIGLLKQI